ncbi:MAG: TetR/AcrR family transcriptional regulator [Acidobacteria bacterium]|nr:TetR/AcrR family transcriptional regulator [Acidobacteriota bacterium]
MTDTKTRILDVAQKLFAEHGFDATSLRAITHEAGVNLASINYHFQSKEALIEALFARHVGPLNAERIRLLDEAESKAGDGPVPVEELVDAFAAPMLGMGAPGVQSIGILFGRMYAEPGDLLRRVIAPQMMEIKTRFSRAFARARPGLTPDDVFWRMHFTIGALAHTLASRGLLEFMSEGRCSSSDVVSARRQLIQFVVGGLRAPSLSENS